MARIYGYWDDELNTFVPSGGAPQQQGAMPIGGNQGSYGVPYNNAPRYNQRFYGPGYAPTNVAVGFNNGPRVRYNYQPRYTGNGYAPRGYNTNMNYGPWYGQQSYATYPPYAPYQPRYEWMPGSNGQPVAVRLGEYQREQPVAYETMFNSQGIPVQVPVYAPMNNSAMPVRIGVSPDGQPYGSANVNYQAAFPQQRARNVQRITTTSKSAGTNLSPAGQPSSFGAALGEQTVNNALGVSTAPSYESLSGSDSASLSSREALIQAEIDRLRDIDTVEVQSLTQNGIEREPKTTEELRALAEATVDRRLNIENNVANSQLRAL